MMQPSFLEPYTPYGTDDISMTSSMRSLGWDFGSTTLEKKNVTYSFFFFL